MRTILNKSDSIECIWYIENDNLISNYNKQKELFKNQGKVNDRGEVEEILLFHGTHPCNLENIVNSNFKLDAVPVQKISDKTRQKKMKYGKGIYFSELPSVSLV